jgi:alpha-1,2-mannosyltransferase
MGGWLTQAARRSGRQRGLRIALETAVVAVVAVGVWVVAHHLVLPLWHRFFDLKVYRGAVQWWVSGEPLYSFVRGGTGYGFTYPPFAALGLSPLSLGNWRVQAWLLSAASLVVVVATTWRFLAPVARRAGRPAVFTVALTVPVVVLMDPVRETIAFGQINLLLVALVLADVVAIRRGSRWAGVGTGLAAAVKLTPAIFVVYFALTGRRRPAAVAVGTFAAATAAAFAVSPRTSVDFWTSVLWDTSRVGRVDKTSNQSMLGMIARLTDQTPPRLVWLLLVALVLVLGLWRAVRAYRAGDELVGLVLTGLTGGLISPISWTHHLYWLVPAVVVLVDVAVGRPVAPVWPFRRPRRRAPAGVAAVAITVACCSSVIWYFQYDNGLVHVGGVLGTLGENAFVLIMAALVVLLPARAGEPVRDDEPSADTAVLAAD